jgi:hypothetical protein
VNYLSLSLRYVPRPNILPASITLTVFPCFFLSYKASARVKLAKTGHGPHSSTLGCICVVRLLFVLFYALFVCKCVLPPGDNPTAVNKYIITKYRVKNHVTPRRAIFSILCYSLPSEPHIHLSGLLRRPSHASNTAVATAVSERPVPHKQQSADTNLLVELSLINVARLDNVGPLT